MELPDYIAATRQNDPLMCAADLYQSMYGPKILQVLREAEIEPQIVITYSPERRCEVVTLAGRKHLIYDRYLGQTFNMMNRLILEYKDTEFAMRYVHKLAAEYMSSRDILLPEALHCADFYNEERGSRESLPTPLRLHFTVVQEAYVMLHEAFHAIYANKAHSYTNLPIFVEDFRERYSDQVRLRMEEPETAKQMLIQQLTNQPQSPRLGISDEDLIDNFTGDPEEKHTDKLILEALESSLTLNEELFCDQWAAIWSAMIHGDNVIDTLRAVYSAHYHLRILRHLEVHVEEYCRFIEESATAPARFLFNPEEYIRSRFMLELCALIGASFAFLRENAKGDSITAEAICGGIVTAQLLLLAGDEGPLTVEFNRVRDLLIQDQAEHFAMLYDAALGFVGNGLVDRFIHQHLQAKMREEGETLDQVRAALSAPDNAAAAHEILNSMLSGAHVSGPEPVRRTKIGRNEPCPCGSGKKYKRCCSNSTEDNKTAYVSAERKLFPPTESR